MWKDHPLRGVGLGAFYTNFPTYAGEDVKKKWPQGQSIVNYAHNEYLQTLAEGGVALFISLLAVMGIFFVEARRVWKAAPPGIETFAALAASSIAIQNLVSVDMRFTISLAMFFALAAVAVSEVNPATVGAYTAPRLVISGVWVAALAWLVPVIIRPYAAQRLVNSTPGFFDERLLDPAKTISDLEELAKKYPNEPSVFEKLAFAYAKEMKAPDGRINLDMTNKAIASFQKAITLDPKRVSAYNNLANTYYTVGRTPEAIDAWNRALEIKPDFVDVHLNLGKIFYVQGRLKESAAHFQQVLKYDPKNAEATVYLKRMVE
jgi:hypothetical protein